MDQQGMNNEQNHSINAEVVNDKKSPFATASMVLGIIAISISFIPFINFESIVLGILALIFGIISLVKKKGFGKAVAGVSLGAISIVVAASMMIMTAKIMTKVGDRVFNVIDRVLTELENEENKFVAPDANKENTSKDKLNLDVLEKLNVEFGDFEVVGDNTSKLQVSLTNEYADMASFYLVIEAVDSKGTHICYDYIVASFLEIGEGKSFELFKYITSDKYEIMKSASFRVAEVSVNT